MNSQEQMGVYKEMEQKGWLNYSDIYRAANSGVYGRMYKLINTFDPVTGQYAISSTEEMNAYLREAEKIPIGLMLYSLIIFHRTTRSALLRN